MVHDFIPGRRRFLESAGKAGLALAGGAMTPAALGPASRANARTKIPQEAEHTIRIAPISHEIAPGKVIRTTAYNGSVPGAVLRLQEGQPARIKVVNESGYPNLIHWHGLHLPPEQDGTAEEGSPIIQPGKSLTYAFTPKPAGTRWYHSHAMAMTDLSKSTYSGEYGFLIVDPAAGDPGRYDLEVMLASHTWSGEWVSIQDMHYGPPPDNGLEVMYHAATLGERMLGHGEPVRVRQGERVLFRILNANASMSLSLALPGHRFQVIALDGNPVPTRASVEVLKLDVGERADAVVVMNNPGVWVLGSTHDDDRNMGMGIIVEYADRRGEPQWISPQNAAWNYAAFARDDTAPSPNETISLRFEKIPGGRGGYNRWLINGKSWPYTDPLFTVKEDQRYRLVLDNYSGDEHPVHLHRHTFEVTKVGGAAVSGLMKDTISMPRFSQAEIDFIADNPGPTFFHCHHQDHMDEGFAGLITYL
ncbi:multicopper oxidase family protein (plasmid) [Microvirga terrae]|uniref:Multicopper oxidase family protein n=1 Tax=Microvirga terrae TaxID=2740529 RepID=A0ABY5RZY4_9HYPH|nr:multicopper oxidase family protein [Microvirga terrae]UVF22568.1 multicopper oxidase family protein [Microvirga terrae]